MLGFQPDVACYAKLLTGGTVPLAATIATEEVFRVFDGPSKVWGCSAPCCPDVSTVPPVKEISCTPCPRPPCIAGRWGVCVVPKSLQVSLSPPLPLCLATGKCFQQACSGFHEEVHLASLCVWWHAYRIHQTLTNGWPEGSTLKVRVVEVKKDMRVSGGGWRHR